MYFKTSFVVNYDPFHVISTKIQVNKNKYFEYQEVEELDKKENW